MFPLFESYLTEAGTYVGIRLDEESKKKVLDYCTLIGVKNPLDPNDLHCTLMYSKVEVEPSLTPETEYVVKPSQLELLGHPEPALVILLDTPELEAKFDVLHDDTGAHYDYDKYVPHITIEYDTAVTKEQMDEMTSPSEEIDELVMVGEYTEKLTEVYKGKI